MTFTAHATPTPRITPTHTAATAAHRRQAGRRPRFSADDVGQVLLSGVPASG
ncbi:hypothetical protein [Corynebacterium variabile]|uniref:hypothetical protein n=1 Tax=Corynebacterium variabile TaxID=1727 RepID=UPI000B28C117|nr:hypothetical protein [Corynebacterium variabile]